MRAVLISAVLVSSVAFAKPVRKPVAYELDGTKFEGVLVYDDAVKAPRPGLVLVPNWLGINDPNLKQAELVAGKQYVVFVADMYGKDAQPKGPEEAGKISMAVKNDRKLMRARVNKALEQLLASKAAKVDTKKLGALGFCFGGTTALELAKSGAKIGAVVAFHAGLDADAPIEGTLNARVLALSGGDDPYQDPKKLQAFVADLQKQKADWTLVEFGGAVHSYTDPDAHQAGEAEYNQVVSKRAYRMMNDFFADTFGAAK